MPQDDSTSRLGQRLAPALDPKTSTKLCERADIADERSAQSSGWTGLMLEPRMLQDEKASDFAACHKVIANISSVVVGKRDTHASLLESMEERQVTVEGETRPLPAPFFVIATKSDRARGYVSAARGAARSLSAEDAAGVSAARPGTILERRMMHSARLTAIVCSRP